MVQSLKWATAHLSRVAGRWARRAGRRARAGRRWARGWVRKQGRWRAQAWPHRLASMGRTGGRQVQAAGGRAGRWAHARAGRPGAGWRKAQACRQACDSRRADTAGTRGARAAGRGSRRGRARSLRGRAGWAAGSRPGFLGARPGRWARGQALGSALGALGPFSIRFDSFFFFLSHQMNTVHCKINFFRKKKLLNSNKIK